MNKILIKGNYDINWAIKKPDCVEVWGRNTSLKKPYLGDKMLVEKISHKKFSTRYKKMVAEAKRKLAVAEKWEVWNETS